MATPWVTLTVDDILGAMTSREREDFGKVSTTLTVPDRVAPILVDLVAEIRGYIASHAGNTLSSDTSRIPPSFRARALAIARWRVLTSIPNYQPGEARKLEWEAAEKFFRSVAEGDIRPESDPDSVAPAAAPAQPAGVQHSAPPSRTGRSRMNGL